MKKASALLACLLLLFTCAGAFADEPAYEGYDVPFEEGGFKLLIPTDWSAQEQEDATRYVYASADSSAALRILLVPTETELTYEEAVSTLSDLYATMDAFSCNDIDWLIVEDSDSGTTQFVMPRANGLYMFLPFAQTDDAMETCLDVLLSATPL